MLGSSVSVVFIHQFDTKLTDLPGRIGRTNIGTCKVPIDADKKPYALAGPGKRHLMKEEGYLINYRYYGDKVFGATPTTNIAIYRPTQFQKSASEESDHEMVYAGFTTDEPTVALTNGPTANATVAPPVEGGRRRKTTRKVKKGRKMTYKVHKSHKSHKSHKGHTGRKVTRKHSKTYKNRKY